MKFFILFFALTFKLQAIDTKGDCLDCKIVNKTDGLDALSDNTTKVAQKFDTEAAYALKRELIHWKCDLKTRKLYITDKSEVLKPENLVQSYNTLTPCTEDELRLNQNASIIVDQNGNPTFHQAIVCLRNSYYLIEQHMKLDDISKSAKKLNPIFSLSEKDCVNVPFEFNTVSNFDSLKSANDSRRVDTVNSLIRDKQAKFLKKKFY